MEKFRDGWVRLALIASLLLPVYFAVAALGTKFGYFDWTLGFVNMTVLWGAQRIVPAVAFFGLIALLLALLVKPRRGIVAALIALAIPLSAFAYALYVRSAAESIPPIHDISTDLDNPPAFSPSVIRARAAVTDGNSLDLRNKRTGDGRAFTDLQREHYADIAPVTTSVDAARTFDIALDLARDEGWHIGETSADTGVIEATDRTFWFGFTDDIAVRVRPEGTGARVDIRSVSRVGRSDLGANAARLRPYLQRLRDRLAAAERE